MLEHHSMLFRDPTNAERRFIPILIEDCDPPGIIAQFAYIDWRVSSDVTYERLLVASRLNKSQTEEASVPVSQVDQARMALKGHNAGVYGVAVTPDGKTVISGSSDTTLKLWDLGTGQCRATLEGHTNIIPGVAVSPDGKNVISSSWQGAVIIWSLETAQCIATMDKEASSTGWDVAISGDGRRFVSGLITDNALGVWDLKNKRLSRKLKGHTGGFVV